MGRSRTYPASPASPSLCYCGPGAHAREGRGDGNCMPTGCTGSPVLPQLFGHGPSYPILGVGLVRKQDRFLWAVAAVPLQVRHWQAEHQRAPGVSAAIFPLVSGADARRGCHNDLPDEATFRGDLANLWSGGVSRRAERLPPADPARGGLGIPPLSSLGFCDGRPPYSQT